MVEKNNKILQISHLLGEKNRDCKGFILAELELIS